MADKIYLPYNRAPRDGAQKFQIAQPFATHYGPVSCRDFDCDQYLNGWKLILSVTSQQRDIDYIRSLRGKRMVVDPRLKISHLYTFKEDQNDPFLITFTFPAGQPCFRASKHVWHVRPPIWIHDRSEIRRVMQDRDFKDLMNEQGYKVERARQRG